MGQQWGGAQGSLFHRRTLPSCHCCPQMLWPPGAHLNIPDRDTGAWAALLCSAHFCLPMAAGLGGEQGMVTDG